MVERTKQLVRVSAIGFLNPAPLMWDFEHAPRNAELATRYDVHYTKPSICADELLAGRADLGLIPVASLTEGMAIVPGCTIASLDRVRSIQLIVKVRGGHPDIPLQDVRTIAADTASRSSLAYAQVLFRKFVGTDPEFLPAVADPIAMLTKADAALLIGDPALLALERRADIEARVGPCAWADLAHEWRTRTGLPWVAAVWALRPGVLDRPELAKTIADDLQRSRDNGLTHIDDLVQEWTPRIAVPSSTIREYLSRNIHYTLEPECVDAIQVFRAYAAEAGVLPVLKGLRFV